MNLRSLLLMLTALAPAAALAQSSNASDKNNGQAGNNGPTTAANAPLRNSRGELVASVPGKADDVVPGKSKLSAAELKNISEAFDTEAKALFIEHQMLLRKLKNVKDEAEKVKQLRALDQAQTERVAKQRERAVQLREVKKIKQEEEKAKRAKPNGD